MKLIEKHPFTEFFQSVGRKTVKKLRLAMPFLSEPIVADHLITYLKNRKTKLLLLTNLSELQVAMALSNPAKPLELLVESLKERVEIRRAKNLHAKLLLADNLRGMAGSSNLTQGGERANWELNFLIGNTGKDKAKMFDLIEWFDLRFERSTIVTKMDLNAIDKTWLSYDIKRKQFEPSPRLGGDYWKKAKQIAHRDKIRIETVRKWLSERDPEKQGKKSPINKLVFLRNLGIVSGWDESWVYVSENARDITDRRLKMAKSISEYDSLFDDLIKKMWEIKSATYSQLENELSLSKGEERLRVAVIWAESFRYLKRDDSTKPHVFSIQRRNVSEWIKWNDNRPS